MAKGMDDLRAAVASQNTVIAATTTLLQGLSDQLKTAIANEDDAALEDIANQIGANSASLAQAVQANTPAAAAAAPADQGSAPAADAPAAPAPDMGNAS